MAEEEAAVLDASLEVVVGVADVCLGVAALNGLAVDVVLDFLEEGVYVVGYSGEGRGVLFESVAAHYLDGAVLDVARAYHEAYRHAF